MKVILTIGGTDCSGGAGIQADMKTILINGCYGTSVVTALAANSKQGTDKLMNIPVEAIDEQLETSINAAKPDAVKIGMLPNAQIVHVVCEKIKKYDLKNVVVNPILLSGDGAELVPRDTFSAVADELLPLADLITPDLNELEYLSGMEIKTKQDIISASKIVGDRYDCTIATKGGRISGDAADLFYRKDYYKWFPGLIIPNPNLHDAGNVISCAAACNIAKGYELDKAYKRAKDMATEMLLHMLQVGNMESTVNHNALMESEYVRVLTDEELSRI